MNRYNIGDRVQINPEGRFASWCAEWAKQCIRENRIFTILSIINHGDRYVYKLTEDKVHVSWVERHLIPVGFDKDFIDLSFIV